MMSRQALIPLLLIAILISLRHPAPLHAQDEPSGVTITTVRNMNLRAGPTTSSEIVGVLLANTTVDVLAQHTNEGMELWLQIPHEGANVWIAGWLVTVTGDLNAVPSDQQEASEAPPEPPAAYQIETYTGPPLPYTVISVDDAIRIAEDMPLNNNDIEGGITECQEMAGGHVIVCVTGAAQDAISSGTDVASSLLAHEAFMARWWTTLLGLTAFGTAVTTDQLNAIHADPEGALTQIDALNPAFTLRPLPGLTSAEPASDLLPVNAPAFFRDGRIVIVQGHTDLWERGGEASITIGAAGNTRAVAVDPDSANTIYALFNANILQQPTANQDIYADFWTVSTLLTDIANAATIVPGDDMNWGAILDFWFPPEFELSAEFRSALGMKS